MADYFLSDVHLRLDRPERSERLARLVETFGPADSLTVVGDLCDFWFASRQRRGDPLRCQGLRALAAFRDRGGTLTVMAGNHDEWLGGLYERALGARFEPGAVAVRCHGVNVHAVHGHRLGARKPWKAALESRAFLHAFGMLPEPIAHRLALRLEHSNEARIAETHRRHLAIYRRLARELAESGRADLVVIGHVHEVFDEDAGPGRLIVPGDWIDGQGVIRIDERGVRFDADRIPARHA